MIRNLQEIRFLELKESYKEENISTEVFVTDFMLRSGITPLYLYIFTKEDKND